MAGKPCGVGALGRDGGPCRFGRRQDRACPTAKICQHRLKLLAEIGDYRLYAPDQFPHPILPPTARHAASTIEHNRRLCDWCDIDGRHDARAEHIGAFAIKLRIRRSLGSMD
jgi:hypothetical protein